MFEVASKYHLQQVQTLNPLYLKEGVYVVLLDVLNIPPHLLLTVSGQFFSISTMGAALDEESEKYIQFIQRKKIPTVFVRLSLPPVFTQDDLLKKIRKITSSYPKVDVGIATCLSPLKDFCSEVYETDKNKISLIFDLLDSLKNQNVIEAYFQLNLEQEIQNGNLSIDKYSMFEVNEAIYGAQKRR